MRLPLWLTTSLLGVVLPTALILSLAEEFPYTLGAEEKKKKIPGVSPEKAHRMEALLNEYVTR